MANEDLNTQLYDKMKAEQDQYRDWLLSQSPEEILKHTYEYTMREDIIIAVDEMDISQKQARALLKSPCPLSDIFEVFRNREATIWRISVKRLRVWQTELFVRISRKAKEKAGGAYAVY